MLRIILFIFALGLVSACTTDKREDMRSPCVGAKGSPCDKHNVNDWWVS